MTNPSFPNLLLIETATETCSVAVSRGGQIIGSHQSSEGREHASKLAVFVQDALKDSGMAAKELDAIVVSKGPGSYTGLRIGIATAKGLCFALDKPLISVDTLLAMAFYYVQRKPQNISTDTVLVPVIDARRMEVYGAAYYSNLAVLETVRAEVLHPRSFLADRDCRHIFFGDAATKCQAVFSGSPNVLVDIDNSISAEGLLLPALEKYKLKQFEDVACFEPYYLKEFIVKGKGGVVISNDL